MTIVLMLYLMGHVTGIPVERFPSWEACAEAKYDRYQIAPYSRNQQARFVCEEVKR